MIRPSRHPCSSPTGAAGLAPAPTARLNIASGSSTTSRVRPVAPPIPPGLNRLRVEIRRRHPERGPVDGELGDDVVALAHLVQHRRPERGLIERDRLARPVNPQFRLNPRHASSRYPAPLRRLRNP